MTREEDYTNYWLDPDDILEVIIIQKAWRKFWPYHYNLYGDMIENQKEREVKAAIIIEKYVRREISGYARKRMIGKYRMHGYVASIMRGDGYRWRKEYFDELIYKIPRHKPFDYLRRRIL